MRLATVSQSRQIDLLSQSQGSLSSESLMEAAGVLAKTDIETAFFPELLLGTVGVVCGPGGNGGDGLVVARHLHTSKRTDSAKSSARVVVLLVAPQDKRSDLFKIQLERCLKAGVKVVDLLLDPANLDSFHLSLVVDAIFGVGFRDQIRDPYLKVIMQISKLGVPVVSLDIPSGLDADRGIVQGSAAIRATRTITFGLSKPGFFVSEGPRHVGSIRVISIGFPDKIVREIATSHFAFNEVLVRRTLPHRGTTTNKSDFGHALVIAGSEGTWGAGVLAAMAAYRMGAGYVTLATKEESSQKIFRDVLRDCPDVLTSLISDEKLWEKPKWNAVAIGPGLGRDKESNEKIFALLQKLRKIPSAPVVVDADAISVIAEKKPYPLPENWILTPHAGELSRILGIAAKEIEADRYRYALEAAKITGCHVLLKGFRTVLAFQGKCWVILSGNSALAKAGTGDVLTGMIVALLAQKLPPARAAAAAAYVHGRVADEWVRSGQDTRSLLASDIREFLPSILAGLS